MNKRLEYICINPAEQVLLSLLEDEKLRVKEVLFPRSFPK